MTLEVSDLHSDSDLDSIRTSCDVFQTLFTLQGSQLSWVVRFRDFQLVGSGLEPHKGLKWGKVLRLQRFYVSSRQRMNHPPRYLDLNTEAGGKFVQSANIISSQIGTFV